MKRTLLAIFAFCACLAVTGCVVVDEPHHNKRSRDSVMLERRHDPGKGAPKAPNHKVEPGKPAKPGKMEPVKPGKMEPAKPGKMNPGKPGKMEPGRNF